MTLDEALVRIAELEREIARLKDTLVWVAEPDSYTGIFPDVRARIQQVLSRKAREEDE